MHTNYLTLNNILLNKVQITNMHIKTAWKVINYFQELKSKLLRFVNIIKTEISILYFENQAGSMEN